MEITGRIILALPEFTGVSKTGNAWKKREYVLETQEQYPKKVFFDFFGERADQYPLQVGDFIRLSFDIDSREYQGRWYVGIRGWKAEKVDPNAAYGAPQAPAAGQYAPPVPGGYAPAAPAPAAPAQQYNAAAPAPQTPAAPTNYAPGDGTEDLPF